MAQIGLSQLTRRQRFGLLAVLYFSQGVPFGLFMQALPVILREGGFSLEAIGFSSLLALPWGLKFLWAPWVDRAPVEGLPRRKGWLVPIQLVTVAVFVVLALLDVSAELYWLLGAVFVVNFLNATQDIATDGLAVDVLEVDERGAGNGLQVGGYRLGMIAGGAGVLVLIELAGWTVGLLVCASILLAALLPLLAVREDLQVDGGGADAQTQKYWAKLAGFFDRSWSWHVLGVAVAFKFGEGFAGGMLRPMLVDQAYSMADIGWMLGGVGFAFGLLGAGAGGLIGDRLRRGQALVASVVVQVLGVALFVPMALVEPGVLQASVLIAVEHFASGVATVVLFACMMDWTRREHTGTDYTVLASAVVISTGVAHALSGVSANHLGYAGHFGLAVALTLAGGVGSLWLFRRAQKLSTHELDTGGAR
ncbi:MFS transporter [Persicimonas caeni]|uniref:MFS transporter n=1 Tax=Persicimonas caeni TaxID=2292766 RepID=A0A4Y6PT00_PERCE|nr:MFS transporter [Persicimonas caeni]QDG51441.1 MFS transporter [Persicimonas caeni]QED32662.1 MFS transporter [Persicimonas caeni]